MRPSDRLTVTGVISHGFCPRMWAYRHVADKPGRPSWIMVAGSAMDDTLNEHHLRRIQGVAGLVGTALTDHYVTKYRKLVLEQEPIGDPDPHAERDGTRLLAIYEKTVSPKIEPLEVQKETTYEIGGRTYLAHIDLIRRRADGARVVSDHKLTLKVPRSDKAAKSLQLRAYDLAVDDPSHDVEFINLVRLPRKPKIVTQPYTVTPADRQELLSKFESVAGEVDSGSYPMCNPDSWICRPERCGYWQTCRGNPNGPEPIPGERFV